MIALSNVTVLIKSEMLLAYRQRAEWLNPILFFIVVVSLFPLALGQDLALLQGIAPGIIWVAALLSGMMSLDTLFRGDFEDGTLEQLSLSDKPLTALILVKLLTHWCLVAGPLILLTPFLGGMLGLSAHAVWILTLSLLLGTPVLTLLGGVVAALVVGLRNNGMLIALLLLPLLVPILIFGASAGEAAATGASACAQLAIEGALLALALSLAPFAIAGAVKTSL